MQTSSPTYRFVMGLAVVAVGSTLGAPSRAQGSPTDTATAQALFDQAKKLMAQGKYAEACPKLEESQRLDPGTGTLLNLGDCYEHQGKLASAWGKFVEAASAAKSAKQVERERVSRDRAAALLPRVSNIVINVAAGATPGLEVKRDDALVGHAQWGTPLPADPGEHKISASAAGRKTWQTVVTVGASGETRTVSVPELEAAASAATAPNGPVAPQAATAPKAPPSSAELAGDLAPQGSVQKWVGVAVAAAGLAAMGGGTIIAIGAKSKYDGADCHGNVCSLAGYDDRQSAIASAKTATIISGIGLAALVGGVTVWLTAPSGRDRAAVGLSAQVRADGASLVGVW
jgi:serine/threonine-protein kinase